MTTIKSNVKFLDLPKNKTGLFAADTIHETKPKRNHLTTIPPLSTQVRHNVSANLLFSSSKNDIQQYYTIDKSQDFSINSANNSHVTLNDTKNAFRPSTVRHQKFRLTTASTQRTNLYYENRDLPQKRAFIPSHTSVKLRSEIDQINNKLTRHQKESSKNLRFQNNRELNDTPQSGISYSASYRGSSASSALTADRIHQRFSSAITHNTAQPRPTLPTIHDTSNRSTQILEGTIGPSESEQIFERDNSQPNITDYRPTHAYQIPQQSNVGSESIFLMAPPSISPIKTRSAKYDRRSKDIKSITCPFYVMHLTNLAMQQRQYKEDKDNTTNKENVITKFAAPSVIRKVPVNSRISTAYPKRQSVRRQVNSPITVKTYSTIDDDDDRTTNSTQIPYNKRLPPKLSIGENENSHMLCDILRTTSWTHVKV